MANATRIVTKALAAAEDLLFGEGTAQQERAGKNYTVTKIRGFYPVNDKAELADLDFLQFPKAAVVQDGLVQFYQHNGAVYEVLAPLPKVENISSNLNVLSAAGKDTVLISSTSAMSLTDITNGVQGQRLTLVSTNSNLTIVSTGNISLKNGPTLNVAANSGLQLVYTGTIWAEV